MKSSIIIVTYNSSKFIEGLLTSLQDFAKGSEVLIIDNNSQDKTVPLAKKFDYVKVLETRENLGFAKGINFGAKNAKGEYLLFLNPDSIYRSGKIEDLNKAFVDDQKLGIVGGKIIDFQEKPEKSAGRFFNFFETIALILGIDELAGIRFSPDKIQKVDFVSGGLMMVRRDLFDNLGGFDENYFMYFEDMDFCFRAQKSGFYTLFDPRFKISHAGQGSSDRSFAILNIYKGLLYFYKNRKNLIEFQIIRFGLLLKAESVYLLGRIINNKYYTKTYGEVLKLF